MFFLGRGSERWWYYLFSKVNNFSREHINMFFNPFRADISMDGLDMPIAPMYYKSGIIKLIV